MDDAPQKVECDFVALINFRQSAGLCQRDAQNDVIDVSVTRVKTQGSVNVTFNVVMKDMKKLGYDVLPSDVSNPAIVQTPLAAPAPSKSTVPDN